MNNQILFLIDLDCLGGVGGVGGAGDVENASKKTNIYQILKVALNIALYSSDGFSENGRKPSFSYK